MKIVSPKVELFQREEVRSMPKRPRLLIALVVFSAFGVLFCVAEKSSVSELKRCEFEIREVYFNETKDPNHVMLTINGTVGQSGFYKYVIHFPPQQGTSQGIGPIEVGRDEPCKNESCKPLNSCQEFQIKEFIARSYPDNVPEFGKSYFAVITFYLNDGSERKWQGSVEWKKTGSKITVKAVPGSATLSFSPFNPVDINTNLGFSEGHAGGLQFLYIPVTQLVWGYRVYLDFEGYAGDPKANGLIGNSWKRDPNYPNLYYRDFKAEYTLMSSGYYVQSDPHQLTLTKTGRSSNTQ